MCKINGEGKWGREEKRGRGKERVRRRGRRKERERNFGKGKYNIWQVTLHIMFYESIMRLEGKRKGEEKGKSKEKRKV